MSRRLIQRDASKKGKNTITFIWLISKSQTLHCIILEARTTGLLGNGQSVASVWTGGFVDAVSGLKMNCKYHWRVEISYRICKSRMIFLFFFM